MKFKTIFGPRRKQRQEERKGCKDKAEEKVVAERRVVVKYQKYWVSGISLMDQW